MTDFVQGFMALEAAVAENDYKKIAEARTVLVSGINRLQGLAEGHKKLTERVMGQQMKADIDRGFCMCPPNGTEKRCVWCEYRYLATL